MINSTHSPRREKGAVTLFMAVIVLALITIVAFYTTRTVLFETKVQANNYRAKQAFENSESAYNFILDRLNQNAANKGGYQAGTCDFDDTSTWVDVDLDANGSMDAEVCMDVVAATGGGDVDRVSIVGYSEDYRAKHYILQTLVQERPLPNAPLTPITAKGGFIVQGSATVYNPEGYSTIWSGGDVDLTQNASSATYVADPDADNVCLDTSMTCSLVRSSTHTMSGLDVVEMDDNLKNLSDDELFRHFFGFGIDEYRSRFVAPENSFDLASDSESDFVSAITGENGLRKVFYIDTNGSSVDLSGEEVGCINIATGGTPSSDTVDPDDSGSDGSFCNDIDGAGNPDLRPTTLIVDGDLEVGGNFRFFGLLYVKGALIKSGGNPMVEGAVVLSGSSASTGATGVWYNSDMLEAINDEGDFFGLSGGWRDWAD